MMLSVKEIVEDALKRQDIHNRLMVALEEMLPPESRIYKETTLWDDYKARRDDRDTYYFTIYHNYLVVR